MMNTFCEPAIIHISGPSESLQVLTLETLVTDKQSVRIIIGPHRSVCLIDDQKNNIAHLEIHIGRFSNVYFISDRSYETLLINCLESSYAYIVSVITPVDFCVAQRLTVNMLEKNSQSIVRVFPVMSCPATIEYITTQHHLESGTLSDFYMQGYIEKGSLGHRGFMDVDSHLNDVTIIQKTTLFLSDQGSAHANPSFQIASKDVRCVHGAAIGSIDDHEMWYLAARGIDNKTASQLLIKARLLSNLILVKTAAVFSHVSSLIERYFG